MARQLQAVLYSAKHAPGDDREQAIAHLVAKAKLLELATEDLDEEVHELAAGVASDVNNSGLEGQLAYLVDQLGREEASRRLDRLAREPGDGEGF